VEPHVYRTMVVREGTLPPARCQNPREVLPVIIKALEGCDVLGKEYFGVLYLSSRWHVVGAEIVSIGCLTATTVHPREVFRGAIVLPCAAIVLFHNHPSGDPEPSAEDLALTRRLAAGGALLGIEVLDHVVVAKDLAGGEWKFISMKDRGVL